MTWTFTNAPATVNRDAVRLLVNDVDETDQKLSDETISWLLGAHSNLWFAASAGANMISATFADTSLQDSVSVGDLSITQGDETGGRGREYRLLGEQLRLIAVRKGIPPFQGGISIAAKDAEEADSDWNQPEFAVGYTDWDTASSSTRGRSAF